MKLSIENGSVFSYVVEDEPANLVKALVVERAFVLSSSTTGMVVTPPSSEQSVYTYAEARKKRPAKNGASVVYTTASSVAFSPYAGMLSCST